MPPPLIFFVVFQTPVNLMSNSLVFFFVLQAAVNQDVTFIDIFDCVSGSCESGWHLHGSFCYQYQLDVSLAFEEAYHHCLTKGSNLASIHDYYENRFVAGIGYIYIDNTTILYFIVFTLLGRLESLQGVCVCLCVCVFVSVCV